MSRMGRALSILPMLAMALALAVGCGDDASSPDAGAADAGSDVGAPRDAGGMDAPATPDVGPDPCGACAAEAPWRCDRCLDSPLQEISAVVVGGQVVVVGGFEGTSGAVTTTRVYDPSADTWSRGPDLPEPRHHVQLAEHGGDVFVFGGMRDLGFRPLRSSFVWRAGTSEWTELAELPRVRAAGAVATLATPEGPRIVIAGGQGEGRSDDESLADGRTTLRYDPVADAWDEGATMPTAREHCASFGYAGELYVLGGRPISLEPTQDTVEIYDPVADEWRAGPAMPSAHGGFAAAVAGDVAVVVGGEERRAALDVVESLDLRAMTWSTLAPVPTPRHGHAMAAGDGRVYVIGGADRPVFAAVDVVESLAP